MGIIRSRKVTLYVVAVLAVCSPLRAVAQDTGLITFDHYHTLAEIQDYLEAVTARHSELATLLEIGASRSGRPIWAVDINNPATGPAEEKPAFYVDGNIHGGEVLGGEGALAFIDRLLGAYGSDPRITENGKRSQSDQHFSMHLLQIRTQRRVRIVSRQGYKRVVDYASS